MDKYISLELKEDGDFFVYLKEEFLAQRGFKFGRNGENTENYADFLVRSTLKTLQNFVNSQNQSIHGLVKLGFEADELKYPQFYESLVNNIRETADFNVDGSNTKKYADLVVGVLHEVANKQINEKTVEQESAEPTYDFTPIKRKIDLDLNEQGSFFRELRARFIENEMISDYISASPIIPTIMPALVKAFKSIAKEQGQPTSGKTTIKYEHSEYTLPGEHDTFMDYIDTALNRKIHSTTLERFADMVVEHMDEVAEAQLEAKNLKAPALVDPKGELKAITQYVTSNWSGFDKIDAEEFFKKAWKLCVEKTKNQIDPYKFTDLVEEWQEEREDHSNWKAAGSKIKEKDLKSELHDDAIAQIPMNILFGTMGLERFLRNNWDYEKAVNDIIAEVKAEFPEVSRAKPKGWAKLAKDYSDYDGMNEFDKGKAKKEFGGMDSGTAGSFPFEVRVSLAQVMYDDKCQGRKPLEVLIGAMVGHAYVMNQRNNASKVLHELLEMKEEYSKPQYFKEIVKEIKPEFKEPLTKALLKCREDKNSPDFEQQMKKLLGMEDTKKKKKTAP
jgi:hypothetical protein